MAAFKNVTINTAEYSLKDGKKGTIAVLMYLGPEDPKKILDMAVNQYVGSTLYHELIDANLDNPWMRVIVSDINDMNQKLFDPDEDKLT